MSTCVTLVEALGLQGLESSKLLCSEMAHGDMFFSKMIMVALLGQALVIAVLAQCALADPPGPHMGGIIPGGVDCMQQCP